MELDHAFRHEIELKLQDRNEHKVRIKAITAVQGGDTHAAWEVETERETYFMKTAQDIPADLFAKEYNGLSWLRQQMALLVAEPLSYGNQDNLHYLLTTFIPKGPAASDFWKIFAKGLAGLHRCTWDHFGWEEDNYIGPLPQSNATFDNWCDFFVSQRLQPLIVSCIEKKLLEKKYGELALHLYKRMPDIFPEEPPALLHGDLWGGNYLSGPGGQPYLFDPAIYYGSREMDLAMTRLFGGFDRQFYWHYEEYFPLAADWQKRISLCQLYPLLVHSLLFGGGYVQQVRRILEEYG